MLVFASMHEPEATLEFRASGAAAWFCEGEGASTCSLWVLRHGELLHGRLLGGPMCSALNSGNGVGGVVEVAPGLALRGVLGGEVHPLPGGVRVGATGLKVDVLARGQALPSAFV